ncbi:hypothetical protein DFH28DRAFT_489201 [Melampsora americana]|nr:hypothetical protein DFH28DRAFT_489201 [Melampsora americana]
MILMNSSMIQLHIFLILSCHLFIRCSTVSRRHIPDPGSTVGLAWSYTGVKNNEYVKDRDVINEVELHDLRNDDGFMPELATNGFTYVQNRYISGIEALDKFSPKFTEAMKEDSVKLVKDLTNAREAVCFSLGYRGGPNSESKKPFPIIHSDLSPSGAEWKKQEIQEAFLKSKDPSIYHLGDSIKRGKHLLILNVWRPVETVDDNPLAICDWTSVKKKDAHKFKVTPSHIGNAIQAWKYQPHQKWFYLSNQKPHEVFVFMQHDSHAQDKHGMNVPHASMIMSGPGSGIPTRTSYEFRIAVVLDD